MKLVEFHRKSIKLIQFHHNAYRFCMFLLYLVKGVHQISWHDPSTTFPARCYSIAMFGQTHTSPYEWLYPTISYIMFPLYHTSLLVISDYTYTICIYIYIYMSLYSFIFLYIPLYPFVKFYSWINFTVHHRLHGWKLHCPSKACLYNGDILHHPITCALVLRGSSVREMAMNVVRGFRTTFW